MGARGPDCPQRWTMPGTPEFYELIRGPDDLTDRSRIDVARRRWKNGGERAVMGWWDSPGERPWAWWRFNCPRWKRKEAEKYDSDLEALVALDLLEPEEREFLEAEGIISDTDV